MQPMEGTEKAFHRHYRQLPVKMRSILCKIKSKKEEFKALVLVLGDLAPSVFHGLALVVVVQCSNSVLVCKWSPVECLGCCGCMYLWLRLTFFFACAGICQVSAP